MARNISVKLINVNEDYQCDDIGKLCNELIYTAGYIKREEIKNKIKENLKDKLHIFFIGGSDKYGLGSVGESYICEIPKNKKGNLGLFRGKQIRLFCIGSGTRWLRTLCAYELNKPNSI